MKTCFKIFSSLVILFLCSSSLALEGFACNPGPRDTHLQVLLSPTEVNVKILNPSGYSMMPQFEGPVSQFLIPFLKMQTEDLSGLGDQSEFVWPREKCQLVKADSFLIDCPGLALRNSNPQIAAQSLSTTAVSETRLDQVSKKLKYRFVFEQTNYYFVSLVFPLEACYSFQP